MEGAAPPGVARRGADGAEPTGAARRRLPPAVRRLAELLALTSFALAQPVLDVTGRSPDFFLYRRATPGDLAAVVALVVLAPPLLLWLAELAVGAVSEDAARALHLGVVAALFTVLAVEVGKHLGVVGGAALGLVALAMGCGLAVLAARSAALRRLVLFASPAPLVFVLTFALTAPAGALMRPAGDGGGSRAVAAHRPPVVFVLLDEFPVRALLDEGGRIDARLFPNFARLAAATTWYPNATGVSGWTPYAIPAMLTGRYPERAVAPSYAEYPGNLFTLLSGSYDVNASESVAQLCPPAVCSGVPAGRATGLGPLLRDTAGVAGEIVWPYAAAADRRDAFEERADGDAGAGGEERAPDFRMDEAKANQPERFTAFLDGLRPADRPTLSFLHLLLPHGPWRYLPSGNRYDAIPLADVLPPQPEGPSRLLASDPVLSALATQRLLLQLAYTDGLVGQMLDRMQASSLFDDALLVVTADHGEGLAPGTHWRSLEDANTADLAWVPLFVKTPRQRAGRVDPRNEQHVDLLPTIADVLDVDVPWRVDGRSLLGPPRPGTDKSWYDLPGQPREFDAARWQAALRTGVAGEVVTPSLGQRGLFVPAAVRGLAGRRVGATGPPSPVRATLAEGIDLAHVRLGSPSIPAMVRGDLDRAPGPASTWFAIAVNGTFAGGAAVVPGPRDGRWRFMGLVDDRYLRDGANDVRLYALDGATVHPVSWQD